MKTRDELNKMTKSDLIDYITFPTRELVEMPSLTRGMTLGTMGVFDRIVQYLCNVRASAGYLSRLMDVFADVEGNITITIKGGGHSISIADLLNRQESERTAQTAADISKMIADKAKTDEHRPTVYNCDKDCRGFRSPDECVGCPAAK
jgi:hypothetical protein